MRAIWKYPLRPVDFQTVRTPRGSKPLCVQTQAGVPCVWFDVNPETEEKERDEEHNFHIIGTGHPVMRMPVRYFGTFQLDVDGAMFVGHVFHETEKDYERT